MRRHSSELIRSIRWYHVANALVVIKFITLLQFKSAHLELAELITGHLLHLRNFTLERHYPLLARALSCSLLGHCPLKIHIWPRHHDGLISETAGI